MSNPESSPVVSLVGKTGVTISAPASRLATPPALLPSAPQPWSTSIFACYKDIGSCCWTMFCPAATFGTLANALDNKKGTKANCCTYFLRQFCCATASLSSKYRARIREKYNLMEKPLSDFATHCFLPQCALCQEYRELKRFKVELGSKAPPSQSMKK
ncbi:hypothetical protein M758_1G216000 [Ceratodon purpureus]|nr:hypothetical protein M758_1G216000 [Ceratodon purpureus]